MTTLVTGARGSIGSALLRRLVEAGRPVRAASRDVARLSVPDGVQTVSLDLSDPAAAAAAVDGITDVFLYAEPDGAEAFAHTAAAAGVEHVVVLSSLSVSVPETSDGGIARSHRLVEDAVRGAGLRTTALRPGAFAGNSRSWARSIRERGVVETPYPLAASAVVDEEDIADVAFAALSGADVDGSAVDLVGPESLTLADQVAILGEVLGRDLEVVELSPEQFREQMAAFAPPMVADSLLGYWQAAVGTVADTTDTATRITGRPARTYRQWAQRNAVAFS